MTATRLSVTGPDGTPQYLISVINDLTERKRSEQRIEHMAHHDALTELPNRAAFNDCIVSTIGLASVSGENFALLSTDLDRFKSVNDVFGHDVGDALLREVARRLESTCQGAFLARLGGDEFAVITPTGSKPAAAEALAERMLSALGRATEVSHVHTPGNSSGIADGAAAILVTSAEYAREHGLRGRARIRAVAVLGSDPVLMLTAPTPASRKALKVAGMNVRDIDLWEINEAFAAVPLKTMRDLEIDPACVNVNGGAIALGHPLGATGAILVNTALDELERRGLATALVTLCIAGGQGIAAVIERV